MYINKCAQFHSTYTCTFRHVHKCMHAYTQLYTGSLKSLNKSISSLDQFSVVDWMEHPNMSEWVNEPNASNKADVSQDCRCQICHRNRIAKRRTELTHEIVHNSSIIAICHSIDCDIVASYIDQRCWEDESCSLPVKWCKFWLDIMW